MIIVFCATAIGFAIAFRICALSIDRKLATRSTLTKIGTVASIASIYAVERLARTRFDACAAAFAPAAILLATFAIECARQESRFRSELYACLNACILRMKAGEGFRPALDGAIADSDARARPRLIELRDVVVFSQQAGGFAISSARASRSLALAGRELSLADRDSHSAIRRCVALRDRIRLEDEFRRKSGQAARQARAQSLVLAGLYLATLAYVASQFGIVANARALAASGAMFVVGLGWTQMIGRKRKWTT